MHGTQKILLLERAYSCFNERRLDELLAMMTDDVQWPDVANGAVLAGKASIRSYWEAQFAVAHPTVIPTDFLPVGSDVVAVITQRILDHQGEPLVSPSTVFHRYTFWGDLVSHMVVHADREAATAP